eukprot:1438898-Rhodomonas_salina.1
MNLAASNARQASVSGRGGKWDGVRGGERWYDSGGKGRMGLGRGQGSGMQELRGGGVGYGGRGFPQDEWLLTRQGPGGDARWDLKCTGQGIPGPSGRCPLGPQMD